MAPEGGSGRVRGFAQTLADAVADLTAQGFVSRERLEMWLAALRVAAERELGPEQKIDADLRAAFTAMFRRQLEGKRLFERVPGVGRYAVSMVAPHLRAELDRRILAAANLIKLRRKESIEATLARFSGWATSIPPGGSGVIDKREVRAHITKDLRQERFERRRVEIDQGHKLVANVAEIVAADAGAIAAEWHHVHQAGYDARPEHLARDGKVFLIRGSWAHREGLVKPGPDGYFDDIDKPSVAPFCRCWAVYVLSPRRLPDEMLTRRGREWIAAGAKREAA